MENPENFFESCLFFNTNALSRYLLKLAENRFKHLNLSPAHASLLLVVYDIPGISPKELSRRLYLTPSTISRFLDALIKKGLINRKAKGKTAFIYPTSKSLSIKASVAMSYKNLCIDYSQILGREFTEHLSGGIYRSNQMLSKYLVDNE